MGFIPLGTTSGSPAVVRHHVFADFLNRTVNGREVSSSHIDGETDEATHTSVPTEQDTVQTPDLEESHQDPQVPANTPRAKCLECNHQCYAFLGIAGAVFFLVDSIITQSLWYLLGSAVGLIVAFMAMYDSAEVYFQRIHVCCGCSFGRENNHRDDDVINDDSIDQMEQGIPLLTSPTSTDTLSLSPQDMDTSYSPEIVTVNEARVRIQNIWGEVEVSSKEGGFFNRSVAKVPGIADGSVTLYRGVTHAGFSTYCGAASYNSTTLGFTKKFMDGVLQRQMTDTKEYKSAVIHWYDPDNNTTSFNFGKEGCFRVSEDHNTFLTVRL